MQAKGAGCKTARGTRDTAAVPIVPKARVRVKAPAVSGTARVLGAVAARINGLEASGKLWLRGNEKRIVALEHENERRRLEYVAVIEALVPFAQRLEAIEAALKSIARSMVEAP